MHFKAFFVLPLIVAAIMIAEAAVIHNNLAPVCPEGGTNNNGQCVRIQQTIDNVIAEPVTTQKTLDQLIEEHLFTMAKTVQPTHSNSEPVCQSDTFYHYGKCVTFDEYLDNFWSTSTTTESSTSRPNCQPEEIYDSGKCVQLQRRTDDRFPTPAPLDNSIDQVIADIFTTQESIASNFEPKCPKGEVYKNGRCKPHQQYYGVRFSTTTETTVKSTSNISSSKCPEHYFHSDGECQPIWNR